ncbi:MAG: M50 family metallopeptidase, partial [Candidatus Thiodiazotropha sp. (ex Lucinoma annulata)]|nr:M50 family metallopeptidase [Candidatus Thiodiazotropha sp. (ex Lucinoma annulata)]
MSHQLARSKFSFILQVVAALVLSAIPILHYPFGWFETLFHELSHGLSAILTGGSIE